MLVYYQFNTCTVVVHSITTFCHDLYIYMTEGMIEKGVMGVGEDTFFFSFFLKGRDNSEAMFFFPSQDELIVNSLFSLTVKSVCFYSPGFSHLVF